MRGARRFRILSLVPRFRSPLESAFLEDHRALTRGLTRLLAALREGRMSEAAALADELDLAVGPHMAFEERHFYPRLVARLGSDYVRRLYAEHRVGRDAVAALVEVDASAPPPEAERAGWIEDLDEMLEHALSCGTLVSHSAGLPEGEQARLLTDLEELRERQVRWTRL